MTQNRIVIGMGFGWVLVSAGACLLAACSSNSSNSAATPPVDSGTSSGGSGTGDSGTGGLGAGGKSGTGGAAGSGGVGTGGASTGGASTGGASDGGPSDGGPSGSDASDSSAPDGSDGSVAAGPLLVTSGLIARYSAKDATQSRWPGVVGPALSITGIGDGGTLPAKETIGGEPFVCFDASQYYMVADAVPDASAGGAFDSATNTLIVVVRDRDPAVQWQFVAGKDDYAWGTGYGIELRFGEIGGYAGLDGVGPADRRQLTADTTYSAMLTDDASNLDFFVNGKEVGQQRPHRTMNSKPYDFAIGGSPLDPTYGLQGCVAEVLLYDRVLSTNERATIDAWLGKRFPATRNP